MALTDTERAQAAADTPPATESRLGAWWVIALVAVQAAHSVEEYLGRLWAVFPPAAFVTGLVSEDRRHGFILINVALLVFGLGVSFGPCAATGRRVKRLSEFGQSSK